MLGFIGSSFRLFVEILMWLILVGCAIAGYSIGKDFREAHEFIGLIVGLVIGLIIDVIIGGYTVTIINMNTHLENIDDNLEKLAAKEESGSKDGKHENVEKVDLFEKSFN